MTKNPIVNALVGLLYIAIVVTIINFVPSSFEHINTIIAPIAFLSLFVFSASSMTYVFLYQPLQLFLENKKKESVDLFLKTLAAFAVSAALLVSVGLYVTTTF